MIVYEEARWPSVRAGELEIAGRRVAVRAVPYSGEVSPSPFRFDPVERRLLPRKGAGKVLVGPSDREVWRRLLARPPGGAALVGPSLPVEEIRGAYLAAAEGAREAGRGVFLLDPEPNGLPSDPKATFVALFAWSPGSGLNWAELSAAASRGIPSGALLPVIPGWTSEPGFLGCFLQQALDAGARFVSPIHLGDDGETRRMLVEARALQEPDSADHFFDLTHHRDQTAALREGESRIREGCACLGIPTIPPRPVGLRESPLNAAAAARLEERAQALEGDEHRSCLLQAAARWIDESGRDLGAVLKEGNFRKIFPFGDEVALEAEQAFRDGYP